MTQDKTLLSLANKRLGWIFLALVFTAVFACPATADDYPRLKSIQPPAEFDAGEIDIHREAARHFDVIGEIFIMPPPGGDSIVVYDVNFDLAPGTRTSGLREGMYVGMKLNSDDEVTSIERLPRPEGLPENKRMTYGND